MTAEERLIELGQYVRSGGSSDAYSGAKLFQQMIEGAGGGVPGAKAPNFLPYLASRVAETVRAVAALDEFEQLTVRVCYTSNLANREQQAAALGIKWRALMLRLLKIRLEIDAWLSLPAEEQRREAALKADAARERAALTASASQGAAAQSELEAAWEQRMRACLVSRRPKPTAHDAGGREKIIS